MWSNYFSAALHNLFRNRAYAAINIAGLAVGFAAALLILVFVRGEYSFDADIPDSSRIFRITTDINQPGQALVHMPSTTANIAAALELDFPEVEFATRLKSALGALKQGDVEILPNPMLWADPDFFRMFPVKVLAGDPNAALARPEGLVLSRNTAHQLFGREDVVGRQVTLNRQHVLTVGAVIEDLPWNSHLVIEAVGSGLASFSQLAQLDQAMGNAGANQLTNVYTYVKLRAGADGSKVQAQMPAFMTRRYPNMGTLRAMNISQEARLVALKDIHFEPPSVALDMKLPGDRAAVRAMMLIAVVILIVAVANFVSMMTARAVRRAVEIGVRRALGATRRQVATQLLAECLFYAALALAVASLAAWLLLPAFNGFLHREASGLWSDPLLLPISLAAWLVVGLSAGLYPALVLSGFLPVAVVRGVTAPGSRGSLRQAMVVLQFGTLVALMIATVTIHRQTLYALNERLKVPGDQVYWSQFSCGVAPALREAVVNLPGVRAASCASEWDQTGITLLFHADGNDSVRLRGTPVDSSYLTLLGLSPIAGRLPDEAHGADNVLAGKQVADTPAANPSIVINEAAARALGYADPSQAAGEYRLWQRPIMTANGIVLQEALASQIIGVVPDFSLGSVRDRIEPMAYYIDPTNSFSLYLKLDGAQIPQTVRAVEDAWKKIMGAVPLKGQFLNQMLAGLHADIQRQASLFSAFAGVAVVVAALGLLGLAIHTAERRTKEIGIRKALGASRRDILRFISWQFARPVLVANLVAWPVAWFFMRRWLQGFAYHVDLGLLTFVLASALALAIAFVTVAGHAVMVSRARPVTALRYE